MEMEQDSATLTTDWRRLPRPTRKEFERHWYNLTISRAELCRIFGVSKHTIRNFALEFGVEMVRSNPNYYKQPEYCPTPEEIAERAAEIRSRWSEAVRSSRMNTKFKGFPA